MRTVPVLLLLLLAACGGTLPPRPPDPPDPPQTTVEITVVTCEGPGEHCLKRPLVAGATVALDPATATTNASGFARLRVKSGAGTLTAQATGYKPRTLAVTTAPGFHQDVVLERTAPPLSRLRAEGRFFLNDGGTYRGRWASGLSLLAKTAGERAAFLDWVRATGFDGVRVMAGDLGWAGQTPSSALAGLPALLEDTRTRGLYLYLVAITGSASGYNGEQYLSDVASLCAGAVHCVLEAANEIGHGSQSSQVNDVRGFEAIAVRVIPSGQLWALGAMLGQDEPDPNGVYPPTGVAPFSTAHLDRNRQPWPEMIRRVREIEAISASTNKPAISGEPIGAGDVEQPGRRSTLPELFYTYGALCRLFELGACVFHFEDGVFARVPSPTQQACADAFLEGVASLNTTQRLGYRNAGWGGADVPVASFTGATRVYSGVFGTEGYTVVVGDQGVHVQWQNGYRVVEERGRRPGVIVWRINK